MTNSSSEPTAPGVRHPIPSSIDSVTPEWLTGVLRDAGSLPRESRVQGRRVTQIGQGAGLMGEIFRVELDVEGDRGAMPPTVVVKLPATHEGSRAQGVALGMYEAEVRFYAELAPRTPSGLPVIYHSDIVPGTADFVIVMEDLCHLAMVDQVAGMTVGQAGAAVRVLADLHAAWWDKVKTPDLEWIPSMVADRIRMVDGLLAQVWPGVAAEFGDVLPPGGLELGEAFSHSYFALQQRFVTRPWTLAHQDYRVENLLFGDPAADEVVVIDWQGIGRGPGAYDVAYLLGGSLSVEDRRAHEDRLVRQYHERLTERGVEYSWGQVWDDYRYAHALGGLAVTLVAGATLDISTARGHALVVSMAQRHFAAALDHDCGRLMQ